MRRGQRKLMLGATVLLLASALVAVAPQPAAACSCYGSPPLRDAVGGADLAVVATIAEVGEEAVRTLYGFPAPGEQNELVLDIEAVVAEEHPATPIDPRTPLVVLTNSQGSACGLTVEVGQRVGLLAYRRGDHLWVSLCGSEVDPDELLDVEIDLPEPSSSGRAEIVTLDSREGPSNVQLRDRRGAVVAYAVRPASAYRPSLSLCPGGRHLVVTTADVETIDEETPHDWVWILDLLDGELFVLMRRPSTHTLLCADADANHLVAVKRSAESLERLTIDALDGSVTTKAAIALNGPIVTWGHVQDGELLVATTTAVFLVNVSDGAARHVADMPEWASPTHIAQGLDGRSAVLAAITGAPDHLLLIDPASGPARSALLDKPGDVAALAMTPDGVLVTRYEHEGSQPSDHVLHVGWDGALRDRLVLGYDGLYRIRPGTWIGIDADGKLSFAEAGDERFAFIAPLANEHAMAAVIEPLHVPTDARARHTRADLRAMLPASEHSLVQPDLPDTEPINAATAAHGAASGDGTASLLAAAFAAALVALVAVALSRRSARTHEQP